MMSEPVNPAYRVGPHAARLSARLGLPALGLMMALLSACAGSAGGKGGDGTSMAALERRALARWQLLIDRKPAEAWAYLAPGYRSTRPVEQYQGAPRNPSLEWRRIHWHGVSCEQPDVCQVRLLLDYGFSAPRAGNIPGIQELNERWLLIDGTWYHLPED